MPAAAVACATSRTATYRRRQPERTVLYRTVQTHLATWLELAQDESGRSTPAHVEREFRRYLECGILAHGFARARCAGCGHDFLVAYSCKGRGVCPSCNARRMVETAAHLADHVIPRLPVRQWVLSVPKRLRYFLQADPAIQNLALHIMLSAVEQGLRATCLVAQGSMARIGAVAFIHRFGALLNPHVHFHCVVVDGVFESGTGGQLPVRFHEMPALDAQQLADIQRNIRRRLLRALTRRGLLEPQVAEEMVAWDHSGGFSLDASVRIEAEDRPGLERLLRYCARPVFALERLRQIDPEHLVYESLKPGPGGSVSLLMTPLELIERLATLIPPPRRHRHRYYGVLAPNAPLRAAVTALAADKVEASQSTAMTEAVQATELGATDEPAHRKAARYVWALLLARIYEVFPLVCPKCGGDMRIIAFINEGPVIREILGHLGEPTSAPRLAPARGPPLWELPATEQAEGESDPQAQPAPDYEFDQRVAW
jgi:hypothetical protein